jgi:hypothetical protein
MYNLFFTLFLMIASCSLGLEVPIKSFTGGQASPLMEARTDFEQYYTLSRKMENMIPFPQGTANKRPGTKYISPIPIALGGSHNIDTICYQFVHHAHGDEAWVSQTDSGPQMTWQSATDYVTLDVDTDERGYCAVIQQTYWTAGIGSPTTEPLKLYRPDGTDTGVVFEFYGDVDDAITGVSGNIGDIRFSPDGKYIYMLQNETIGALSTSRLHKYNLDGTRVYRKDYSQNMVWGGVANDTLVIDSEGYIYMPAAAGGTSSLGQLPAKVDPSDGSIIRTYSGPKSKYAWKNSCIDESLGYAYFCGSYAVTDPRTIMAIAIDSDTYTLLKWQVVLLQDRFAMQVDIFLFLERAEILLVQI